MPDNATLKDIRTDIDLMKDFLRKHVGTTYAEATQRSDDNKMSVDMKDWGGRTLPRSRSPPPLDAIAR